MTRGSMSRTAPSWRFIPATAARTSSGSCPERLLRRAGSRRGPCRVYGEGLEERIVEGPAVVGGPAQVGDSLVPAGLADEVGRKRVVPDGFDHGRERVAGEAADEGRAGLVRVYRPRADNDIAVSGVGEQRLQLPAEQRVAAGGGLEPDQAVDRRAGMSAVRVEEGRPMVALDHRDSATRPEHSPKPGQRPRRVRQVLKDEAYE